MMTFAVTASSCGSRPEPTSDVSPVDLSGQLSSVDEFRELVANQDWQAAWKLSDAVLVELGDDPDTLEVVAMVAFRTDQQRLAADLLVDAAKAQPLPSSRRVERAVVSLITVGRIFDAIELLESFVAGNPHDVKLRRWLLEFLTETEQHDRARELARNLVRRRHFDIEMLILLLQQGRREFEVKSIERMVERNPDDARPLIGLAKFNFDQSDCDTSLQQVERILNQHPDFLPAKTLQGRCYVLFGRYDRLPEWTAGFSDADIRSSSYWLTIGDWATHQGERLIATEAYGAAAIANPDDLEIWTKYAASLARIEQPSRKLQLSVRERISRLTHLKEHRKKFEKSGKTSLNEIIEISRQLALLGRLWEAEAWAAIGTSLGDHSNDTNAEKLNTLSVLRTSVVSRLTKQTPWHVDLPSIPKPSESLQLWIAKLARSRPVQSGESLHVVPGQARLPVLVDEAKVRGLNFFGRCGDNLDRPGIRIHRTLGCGGGTCDFDLDGWPDLVMAAAGGQPGKQDSSSNAVFRNRGGRFADVTSLAGVVDQGFGQGIAVGDVNEDGFPDFLTLNYDADRLWINNGDGTFADQSLRWLVGQAHEPIWSTSAAIADIDGDGISDIFIAHYCEGLRPSIENCTSQSSITKACSPTHFPAHEDQVMQGTAAGKFRDVTNRWALHADMKGRGLGVLAGDFDDDRGIDLMVLNDMTYNHLWQGTTLPRDQSVSFQLQEVAPLIGLSTDVRGQAQGSMGVAVGYFNEDRRADFFVTNFENEYSTLYLSAMGRTWRDRTLESNLADATQKTVAFGCQAVDLDLNSEVELVVTNGHVDFLNDDGEEPNYFQPFQVFQKASEIGYRLISDEMHGEYVETLHCGRALWTIDVNKDFKPDLVVTHQTEPAALLVNQTPVRGRHAIVFRLVGTRCSRDAIGTKLEVRSSNGRQLFSLCSGDGYFCSNERNIVCGLDDGDATVEVTVRWPDGSQQIHSGLAVGHEWSLAQGDDAFELSTITPSPQVTPER